VKLHPLEADCFESISTAMITDFIATRVRERGYAPKTANRYREVVGRVFSWALKEGRIRTPAGANPAARVERYRERAPEIRYLTLAQIDEQLDALRFKPRLRVMVATLIYAGLRREELLWLQVDDWARATPAAPGGLLRVRAKTVAGESWQPKTKRNRVVPVSSQLREHLERYVVPASDQGWLFPSPKGARWNGDNFAADLRSANTRTGLSWSCLDYRHTFGSQLAQRGVSLYQIATLMGNSPDICRRHYAALSGDNMVGCTEFNAAGSRDRQGHLIAHGASA
jgi:integrase